MNPVKGLQEADNPTPKHPRCEKKKAPFPKPFEVDRDKDKRLATELDALNRTHGVRCSKERGLRFSPFSRVLLFHNLHSSSLIHPASLKAREVLLFSTDH